MTYDETGTMLAMLTTVYTDRLMPKIDDKAIRVWAQLLADLDYRQVQAAVAAWMTTERFPPTIADIRGRVTQVDAPEPGEAWGLIKRAVALYGERERDVAAFLPPDVWAVCRQRGWSHYCLMDEREEATNYAQFRDAYRTECRRAQERAQIPANVQRMLSGVGQKQIGGAE